MKKYFMVCLLIIVSLFININGVNGAIVNDGGSGGCSYGVVCRYQFCGDSTITNCDLNYQTAVVDVAYRCSDSDKSTDSCSKFTSEQGGCKANGDGEGSSIKLNFSIKNIDSEISSGDAVYCYDSSLNQNGLLDNDKYQKCLDDTKSIPANTFLNHFKKQGYTCPSLKISGSGKTFSASYSSSSSGVVKGEYVRCVSKDEKDLNLEGEACKITDSLLKQTVEDQMDDIEEATGTDKITVSVDTITAWASKQGYDVNSIGDPCTIISPRLKELLNTIFWAISIIGIILVVVMTALSFIKAIVGSDDEKFRDAFRHLLTRIIIVIVLLLLPMILSFIITLINDSASGEVTVGKDGNIFCDIAN